MPKHRHQGTATLSRTDRRTPYTGGPEGDSRTHKSTPLDQTDREQGSLIRRAAVIASQTCFHGIRCLSGPSVGRTVLFALRCSARVTRQYFPKVTQAITYAERFGALA